MRLLVSAAALLLVALLAGCAASGDPSTQDPNTTPSTTPPAVTTPAPAATQKPAPTPAQDTVSVAVQKTQKPAYEAADPVKTEPATPSTPAAAARFGVQIGAYKLAENADAVAASAKLRFARTIYTLRDETTGLVKVIIGDFSTKEEARAFRDRMAQQYPGDYKDAWVSDIAK